jgi:hypothetical protein
VRNFKVGDRVCVLGYGHGTVLGTVSENGDVPVLMDYGWSGQFSMDQVSKENKMVKDDDVVTATAGRIRSAAGKCPQANQVLREVYPEVFIEDDIQLGDVVKYNINAYGMLWKLAVVIKDGAGEVDVEFFEPATQAPFANSHLNNGKMTVTGIQKENLSLIHRPSLNCTTK